MTIERLTNVLVMVTLIEMMMAIGLTVPPHDLIRSLKDWKLLGQAALANYIAVPSVTIGLLLLFDAQPMVAAGFLILAACPGAPYGPAFTGIARGNVPSSVGLMTVLAASSAVVAPILLRLALPSISAGAAPMHIDPSRLVIMLLLTQLAPLAVGLAIRWRNPSLAGVLRTPATLISKVLNLLAIGLILVTQFPMLLMIRTGGLVGMLILLVTSLTFGWALGGPGPDNRKTMALTTSLRNVGVGLVIATGAFAGSPAVTAVLAYGLVELIGSLLIALWWGREPPPVVE